MSKAIYLTNSKEFALVDHEDFERVRQHTWALNRGSRVMSSSRINGTHVHLSRFILGLSGDDGTDIDHKNRNGLDNRRSNFRVCPHSNNIMNSKKRTGTSSKYKGVCWSSSHKRWLACVRVNGKTIHLGHFKIEDDAAKAVNKFYETSNPEYRIFNIIA